MVKASNKRRGVDSRKEWNRQKMVELSNEKIEEILHKETQKTEEKTTILRAVYTRYMRLYENYFDDIEALNDDKIAELRKYHEKTRSFIKYYYMDIPYDICAEIIVFDDAIGMQKDLFGRREDLMMSWARRLGNGSSKRVC